VRDPALPRSVRARAAARGVYDRELAVSLGAASAYPGSVCRACHERGRVGRSVQSGGRGRLLPDRRQRRVRGRGGQRDPPRDHPCRPPRWRPSHSGVLAALPLARPAARAAAAAPGRAAGGCCRPLPVTRLIHQSPRLPASTLIQQTPRLPESAAFSPG
jgi:hypothetical protein